MKSSFNIPLVGMFKFQAHTKLQEHTTPTQKHKMSVSAPNSATYFTIGMFMGKTIAKVLPGKSKILLTLPAGGFLTGKMLGDRNSTLKFQYYQK